MGQRSVAGRWLFPRFLQICRVVKVQFAEFTLDTEARRLSRQGVEVHLSSKAFDLLRLLVERRPKVLDKASLHAQLWPRTFVVDANLTVLVAELRRALADNAREPRFIRTVHTHGYAFCGEAVDLEPQPAELPASGARCWLMWNERAIVLADGASIIGRDPDSPVWLDASGVSRRHARIEVERGGAVVRIQDLESKNGTLVDGVAVRGVVPVASGSVIQIGSVALTLKVWSRGQAAETERIARRTDKRR
jgi:DNA-binding winged helix-turn-helix (wHTH) protein